MKNSLLLIVCTLLISLSWGQENKALVQDPSVRVMMAKIPTIKLSKDNLGKAFKGVKKVDLAPVISSTYKGSKKLEDGQIIGAIVTTGLEKLPNGKHYIYIARVGTQWKAYAFSGNKIRLSSEQVEVRNAQAGNEKPVVSLEPSTRLKVCAYSSCAIVTVKW